MAQEFTPSYTFSEDRLNELKQLFPEAFEDGIFNVDTLKELIGDFTTDNSSNEHFGLNWVGKQDARRIASKPPTGTLKPCLGEGVNEDTTENIFIEGENLEVLKILKKSYSGQIKMIYIDPPYNTGNDFIYNDTFADSTEDYLRKTGEKTDEGLLVSNPKSSGKFHANWLSFMYPRLRIAKDLLNEDGIIFISIDDNEKDNLKKLCDEIYGEENFISCFIWKSRQNKDNRNVTNVSIDHEYVLCYGKFVRGSERKLEQYTNPDNDPRGPWASANMVGLLPQELRPNCHYDLIHPDTNINYGKPQMGWRYDKKRMKSLIDEDRIIWPASDTGRPRRKLFLSDLKEKYTGFSSIIGKDIYTRNGSKEVEELFGFKAFDFPKPTELLQEIITQGLNDTDGIVLDFFAGSGSTAHSIINLNKNSSSKIKYIAIQIPETINENSLQFKKGFKNISDITRERIKRADNNQGFKVFQQNTSTIYKWQDFKSDADGGIVDLFSKLELDYKTPLLDGVKTQDFVTEILLQEGFPLTAKQEEIVSGVFKITHEWVPYTLYASMLYSFKDTDFSKIQLQDTDHLVCLDKAFEGNDSLKQMLDNQCKLFTI